MLPFIELLMLHLALDYPDGVEIQDLYTDFFRGDFTYEDVQIGVIELSGSAFVEQLDGRLRASVALYEDRVAHYKEKLYMSRNEHDARHYSLWLSSWEEQLAMRQRKA